MYDPSLYTKVKADSSSYGLGAVLSQKSEDGTWHPVAYASRSLSSTEKRYAKVEKEALASAWACNRFEDYLIGLKFILETDHKPLVALLGTKSLDELPAHIQRIRMRLMRFSYAVVHVPGKELYTADTLSRAPGEMHFSDSKFHAEIDAFVNLVLDHVPATDVRLEQIWVHQLEDEVCRNLTKYVEERWPEKWRLPGTLQQY